MANLVPQISPEPLLQRLQKKDKILQGDDSHKSKSDISGKIITSSAERIDKYFSSNKHRDRETSKRKMDCLEHLGDLKRTDSVCLKEHNVVETNTEKDNVRGNLLCGLSRQFKLHKPSSDAKEILSRSPSPDLFKSPTLDHSSHFLEFEQKENVENNLSPSLLRGMAAEEDISFSVKGKGKGKGRSNLGKKFQWDLSSFSMEPIEGNNGSKHPLPTKDGVKTDNTSVKRGQEHFLPPQRFEMDEVSPVFRKDQSEKDFFRKKRKRLGQKAKEFSASDDDSSNQLPSKRLQTRKILDEIDSSLWSLQESECKAPGGPCESLSPKLDAVRPDVDGSNSSSSAFLHHGQNQTNNANSNVELETPSSGCEMENSKNASRKRNYTLLDPDIYDTEEDQPVIDSLNHESDIPLRVKKGGLLDPDVFNTEADEPTLQDEKEVCKSGQRSESCVPSSSDGFDHQTFVSSTSTSSSADKGIPSLQSHTSTWVERHHSSKRRKDSDSPKDSKEYRDSKRHRESKRHRDSSRTASSKESEGRKSSRKSSRHHSHGSPTDRHHSSSRLENSPKYSYHPYEHHGHDRRQQSSRNHQSSSKTSRKSDGGHSASGSRRSSSHDRVGLNRRSGDGREHSQSSLTSTEKYSELQNLSPDIFDAEMDGNEHHGASSHSTQQRRRRRSRKSDSRHRSRHSRPQDVAHDQGVEFVAVVHEVNDSDDDVVLIEDGGLWSTPDSSSGRYSRSAVQGIDVTPSTTQAIQQLEEDEAFARNLQEMFDNEERHWQEHHSDLGEYNDGRTVTSVVPPNGLPPFSFGRSSGFLESLGTSMEQAMEPAMQWMHYVMPQFVNMANEVPRRRVGRGQSRSNSRRRPRSLVQQHEILFHPNVSLNYDQFLELADQIGDAEEQGLPQAELNMLPTFTFDPAAHLRKKSEDEGACSICMMDYEEGEELRRLPCFHMYHTSCIDKWLKGSRNCPVCRERIQVT